MPTLLENVNASPRSLAGFFSSLPFSSLPFPSLRLYYLAFSSPGASGDYNTLHDLRTTQFFSHSSRRTHRFAEVHEDFVSSYLLSSSHAVLRSLLEGLPYDVHQPCLGTSRVKYRSLRYRRTRSYHLVGFNL